MILITPSINIKIMPKTQREKTGESGRSGTEKLGDGTLIELSLVNKKYPMQSEPMMIKLLPHATRFKNALSFMAYSK